MARLIFFALLLLNGALAAWLWHDGRRPEPDYASRERDADSVRVMSAIPPSEGAVRLAARRQQAVELPGSACVALTGLTEGERDGVRDAVAGLALGDRVREQKGGEAIDGFVFREPDTALLAWLGRLQRGLDAARLLPVQCPAGPQPAPAPGKR